MKLTVTRPSGAKENCTSTRIVRGGGATSSGEGVIGRSKEGNGGGEGLI